MAIGLKWQETIEILELGAMALIAQSLLTSVVDYVLSIGNADPGQIYIYTVLFACAVVLFIVTKLFLLDTSSHRQVEQYFETQKRLESKGYLIDKHRHFASDRSYNKL